MYPPFSVPGHPTAWIDHVRLAWRLLKPGGRLTAIVPNGYVFRTDRRHTAIRALVDQVGGRHVALPDDAFSKGGVRTVVLTVDKPLDHDEQARQAEPAPPRRWLAGRLAPRVWSSVSAVVGQQRAVGDDTIRQGRRCAHCRWGCRRR